VITHLPTSPQRGTMMGAAVALAGFAALALASSAHGARWALVSCNQADGQPAPIEGWRAGVTAEGRGSYVNCGIPGGALVAQVSDDVEQPAGQPATWTFTAPEGATVAGGALSLDFFSPEGSDYAATPKNSDDFADVFAGCAWYFGSCGVQGQSTPIPADELGGTEIFLDAECLPSVTSHDYCQQPGDPQTGSEGLDARAEIRAATIELEDDATPIATGFSGGLLANGASGLQHLLFTASAPSGPGILSVDAVIDGKTVYDQTPDTNSGKCQSVGNDSNGVPEFLYQQPCKRTVAVSIPVDTSEFATGAHELTVTVTDAAGNNATVFDGTINTFNASSQVPWSVTLRVSPLHVHRHSVITLAGSVAASQRSADGKLVYLQARTARIVRRGRGRSRRRVTLYGPWITFQALSAKPNGAFSSTYRFRLGGSHRYEFRAVAPQEGNGGPPTTGTSASVAVRET
jgi:hypothetical protein